MRGVGTTRARRLAFAALLAASAAALPARAGGVFRHVEPTPEEKRAEATAARWRETGLAAGAEMIDAICRDDKLLAGYAHEVLGGAGARALPLLARAAANPDCRVGGFVASIVCEAGEGQADLIRMLQTRSEPIVLTAIEALDGVAKVKNKAGCQDGPRVLAATMPALRGVLRASSGKTREEALYVAMHMGPLAAPLVPELVAALDGPDVASNIAASALGEVGPAAAPAVSKLRALLAGGGKWRYRAIEALGGIGEPARAALPEFAPVLERTIPLVCRTPGTYTEDDVTAGAILDATAHIGGREAEPLVANLAAVFERMRGCRLIDGI
jgi:hypothetical protein